MGRFLFIAVLSVFVFSLPSNNVIAKENIPDEAKNEVKKAERIKNKVKYKNKRMKRKSGTITKIPKRTKQYNREKRKRELEKEKEEGYEAKTSEERRAKRKNRISDKKSKKEEAGMSRRGYGSYDDILKFNK